MQGEFVSWFKDLMRSEDAPSGRTPHPWQIELAVDPVCRDRLIRVPTGLGKTAGTVLAWLWNRVRRDDPAWPRRLVFCLPMRVLVEQTDAEIRGWLSRGGYGNVGVYRLMGGCDVGEWHLAPERPAVLIGTQDMLLSRALNRGYASPRARWPVEFGLLHQDALWVMDEVQLMDVGLATSAQLQAFRRAREREGSSLRPCRTWWMSATLQRRWMETADTRAFIGDLPQLSIDRGARVGGVWEVQKTRLPVEVRTDPAAIAERVVELHDKSHAGEHGRITLAIFNTVEFAVSVHAAIAKQRSDVELRLVHSRFRGHERKDWRTRFLERRHCSKGADRIIISTQVVEAGVDVSATTLVSELAPWPSLVQRFGRAARYGGKANVLVLDREVDEKGALPYAVEELNAARDEIERVNDVSQAALEDFEAGMNDAARATLYPYAPLHILTRRELEDLFDTTPDLMGADLDVSRFIRSGDERDVLVFWRDVPKDEQPPDDWQPGRDELCPVSFLRARDWLCVPRSERLKEACRAWVWSYLKGAWQRATRRDLIPGRTVLVERGFGGYHDDHDAPDPRPRGFTGERRDVPSAVPVSTTPAQIAEESEAREDLSAFPWKTVATHGREVGAEARRLAGSLAPSRADLLDLAGRWHDLGKAHAAFQACIRADASGRPARTDLAKAPDGAWLPLKQLYRIDESDQRRGFRHELASALALFGVLRRCHPEHPALLGAHRELFMALGFDIAQSGEKPGPLEAEILALSAADFDLLVYLVASHHGKVRTSLHASPRDQDYPVRDGRGLPIRGVREGDRVPPTALCDGAGKVRTLPELGLTLAPATLGVSRVTGASWSERALGLLRRHGPFALAFLEALLRAADVNASRLRTPDPLLGGSA